MNVDRFRKVSLVSLRGCMWVLLLGLIALSVLYGSFMAYMFYLQAHPEHWPKESFGPLSDGNTVTDPLRFILNWVAPVGVAASVALVVLAWLGQGKLRSAVLGSALAVCAIVSLVSFGLWFFHTYLAGYHLQNEIWWMARL